MATLYGLKQAAMAFWVVLLTVMRKLGFEKSGADPCLYFKWNDHERLNIWISWVDDLLAIGTRDDVELMAEGVKSQFDVDDLGTLEEYVGCKIDIDRENRSMRFTQPVLLQSYQDEFKLPDLSPVTPLEAGRVLVKCEVADRLPDSEQSVYRSGVGKLLHMSRWSRPETQNSVRELSRQCKIASQAHMKAMLRVMKHCSSTPKRGWYLKPERKWDGSKDFEFIISGNSDSDYAKCPDTRRSVSGWCVKLEGAPVSVKSSTQKIVALSVTEAELYAAVQCVQDMLYVMRLLNSMGLKVKKPMVLKVDNKGAVDLINGWSVCGRSRHIEVKQHFIRELKQLGTVIVVWIPGDQNESDLYTKNLGGPDYNRHTEKFCGEDKYYVNLRAKEGVGA